VFFSYHFALNYLRESVISKLFPGDIPPDHVKRRREGRREREREVETETEGRGWEWMNEGRRRK
jgi:hypothetical protein